MCMRESFCKSIHLIQLWCWLHLITTDSTQWTVGTSRSQIRQMGQIEGGQWWEKHCSEGSERARWRNSHYVVWSGCSLGYCLKMKFAVCQWQREAFVSLKHMKVEDQHFKVLWTHIGDYRLSMEAADSSPPTEASRVAVRLPTNQQAILAGQPEGNWKAAVLAPQPPLVSVAPNPDSTALLQGIEDLSLQAAALSTVQDRLRASFRDPRPSLHPQQDRPREALATPASRNNPGHTTTCHATTTPTRPTHSGGHIHFPARCNLSDHLCGGGGGWCGNLSQSDTVRWVR
jgi:hypothetical protein